LVEQVVALYALLSLAAEFVHDATGTLVVVEVLHEVDTKLLPDTAADVVQLAVGVGPVVTGDGQDVATQLLPEVAGLAVQLATGTLFVVIGVGQVTVIQFGAVPITWVHEATGTLVVITGLQLIETQLFEASAVCAVHADTGVFT